LAEIEKFGYVSSLTFGLWPKFDTFRVNRKVLSDKYLFQESESNATEVNFGERAAAARVSRGRDAPSRAAAAAGCANVRAAASDRDWRFNTCGPQDAE
jgi:hypothetical protein